jgi:hypothetical protein
VNSARSNKPPDTAASALPPPGTGLLACSFEGIPAPTLTISTRTGSGHHLLKIEDWDSRQQVALIFVRDGEQTTVHVPAGSYRIKFASGDEWFGVTQRFGAREICTVAVRRFEFSHHVASDKERWTEESIELYPQPNGNMATNAIPREQF